LLPSGTVTFLFTDIEGSTKLWEKFPEAMGAALALHDEIAVDAVQSNGGIVVKSTVDGLHAVFPYAGEAVMAVIKLQELMVSASWPIPATLRVRTALHSGEAELREGDYYGPAVNRAARLMSAAAGGQILLSSATAELVQDQLPAGTGLLDMGEHLLRSLDRPEHIFQILHPELQRDFPPLKTSGSMLNNIPSQLTSFIGREKERKELIQLVRTGAEQEKVLAAGDGPRLITLTGPGGTGKTRLSLQVASDLLDIFSDGVWLVELAPVTDPQFVVQTTAAPMGLLEHPGRPLLETLIDHLRPRKVLLIIDNCEHLIDECAQLADQLLRSCPLLRILASSREALGIAGERAIRLRSMALPPSQNDFSMEEIAGYEAIRLFVVRAESVKSGFSLTSENAAAILQICRRLDGIPLAIELAAARVRMLAPSQIATRLDDRFRLLTGGSRTALPRQRTLQALIDWSYDLLSGPECILLRRLSAFSGGWTLTAAEQVAGTEPLESYEVLDLLDQLVNKSLVQTDEIEGKIRYRMLETIRQYAQEKLAESTEAPEVRDRHLRYFADQNAEAWQALLELRPNDLDRRLAMEGDNIRAARAWALENDLEMALSLAAFRSPKLNQFLPAAEALRYVEKVLNLVESMPALVGDDAPIRIRSLYAGALSSACNLAFGIGRNPLALGYGNRAAEIAREIDDASTLCWALGIVSVVHNTMGETESSSTKRDESFTLAQSIGNRWMEALSLVAIRPTTKMLANRDQMWSEWETGMAMFRRGEEAWGQAVGNHVVSFIFLNEGDLGNAEQHALRAMELWDGIGDRQFGNAPRGVLAEIARMSGELDKAELLNKEAMTIWREVGNFGALARCLECLAFIERARIAANQTAAVAGKENEPKLHYAVILLSAAHRLRESHDTPMTAAEEPEFADEKMAIFNHMGELKFNESWQEGRVLDTEQIMTLVLANRGAANAAG